MSMRITARDQKLLAKLAAARWLTTRQIAALCFPGVNIEMARRRLRLLRAARYVFSCRTNRMAETLHTLGPEGKEMLIERGWKRTISLARRPPANLQHHLGINEIRIAVECCA